jgi:hypothetical protein
VVTKISNPVLKKIMVGTFTDTAYSEPVLASTPCMVFEFDITNSLQKGVNKIKLVVTNTLANAYSPREVELKMEGMFPPRSGYESKQRGYERESLASGLFGPVAIKY